MESAALAEAQLPAERLRAIAKRSQYVRGLERKLAEVRKLLADPSYQKFTCPDCGSDEFHNNNGEYTCHHCRSKWPEKDCVGPGGQLLVDAIAEAVKE